MINNKFKKYKPQKKTATTAKDINALRFIDCRFARERAFCGNDLPLLKATRPHKKTLNSYSVNKSEFAKMIETFDLVNVSKLSKDYKPKSKNSVITIDEDFLSQKVENLRGQISKTVQKFPQHCFWIIEKDIILLNDSSLYYFHSLLLKSNIHLCLDLHFMPSVYLKSTHLFSDDKNISLFTSLENYYEQILSVKIFGKNTHDFKVIDDFILKNIKTLGGIKRVGRYLFLDSKLGPVDFLINGVICSKNEPQIVLAFPTMGRKAELIRSLEKIHSLLKKENSICSS